MSKKKHPEHVNHERWLVSYADFITLLFAFFVVLFATSQSDKKKQSQLAAAMQAAFSPTAVFEAHAKTPPLTESAASGAAPIALPVPQPDAPPRHATGAIDDLRKKLEAEAIAGGLPPGSLTTHLTDEGLVISLQAAGFFASGSAEVRVASLPVLAHLAASLPPAPMRVEGHTDVLPIHTPQYPTNWELSSARATAIARYLLDHSHISPSQMAATGYAEFHPVATNATEEGRAQNRRVDIVLLSSTPSHPTPSR